MTNYRADLEATGDRKRNALVNDYISQIDLSQDQSRLYVASTMGLCCLDTGYAEDGMLGMFQLFGADYLSVRLSGAYGERLMLIDKDIKIALDITASQCYIESSAPVAIESLHTQTTVSIFKNS